MNNIIYKYIDYSYKEFEEIVKVRFDILFKPYGKINKYTYDEFDEISFHLIALMGNKIIAYSRMTNINGTGKISNVFVLPEYNKMGIGKMMLKKHILKAKEEKINNLYLEARLDTINFYKKVGFVINGESFISAKSGLPLQRMFYFIK